MRGTERKDRSRIARQQQVEREGSPLGLNFLFANYRLGIPTGATSVGCALRRN
jgi:hypothetical protein